MIIIGLSSWIRSQEKPMRSNAPGAKFSTSTSHSLIKRSKISLPFGVFVLTVIERLLWFNIVKYKLSASGISRNWPRVASPSPDFSTLITSAPNQASNWVQVGPDWTWVKSRTFTPSNAFAMIKVLIRLKFWIKPILPATDCGATWHAYLLGISSRGCPILAIWVQIYWFSRSESCFLSALSSAKRSVSSRITAATPLAWCFSSNNMPTVNAMDKVRPSLCFAGTFNNEVP